MKNIIRLFVLFTFGALVFYCGGKKELQPSEDRIRAFLTDIKDTYGWKTDADQISLDFFPDGRLHIQGPDGEATMWTGSWKLSGSTLTMQRADLEKEISETVKIDGEKLILGGKTYIRYKP